VTGSALSWRIVLSRCDVITVEVVLKVISVGTPAIRHIHVKKLLAGQRTDTVWLQCFINYGSNTEHYIVQKDGSYNFSIWQELACTHTDP